MIFEIPTRASYLHLKSSNNQARLQSTTVEVMSLIHDEIIEIILFQLPHRKSDSFYLQKIQFITLYFFQLLYIKQGTKL